MSEKVGGKVTSAKQEDNPRLKTIHEEYTRLSQICTDILADRSYFKFLGLISIIIVWDPFLEAINTNQPSSNLILFLGFIGAAILIGVIALQELVVWSHFWFYVGQLKNYEVELRKELKAESTELFRVWTDWEPHMTGKFSYIYKSFMAGVLLPAFFVPVFVFFQKSVEPYYFLGFIVVWLIYGLLYLNSIRFLYPEKKQTKSGHSEV